MTQPDSDALVEILGLDVRLEERGQQHLILDQVALTLYERQITVVVGASGSGKSVLLKSLLGIQPGHPGITAGRIRLKLREGQFLEPLQGLDRAVSVDRHGQFRVATSWRRACERKMAHLWGSRFGLMTQQGSQALDPTQTAGASLKEAIRARRGGRGQSADLEREAQEWLSLLRLEDPKRVMQLYPAQLSGGMAQRVVLALVLARGVDVLFADEPTTGLDEGSQDAMVNLLSSQCYEGRLSALVLVTHDFGIARRIADRVIVVDRGRIVEEGGASRFFGKEGPTHPVSRRLLSDYDQLAEPQPRAETVGPVRLRVKGLRKTYRRGWRRVNRTVLEGVDLEVRAGEIVGLMGVSGSGKTTLASSIVRIIEPDSGTVELEGVNVLGLPRGALRRMRRDLQLLYQQPGAALHPRMRVEDALKETAISVLGMTEREARAAVERVLDVMQLQDRRAAYASQLSGGQLRRVGLARVLLLEPRVLIADEPTAGVDASLRAEVLRAMSAMRAGPGKTCVILISHDRRVVSWLSDRVVRMEDGRIEGGRAQEPRPITNEGGV